MDQMSFFGDGLECGPAVATQAYPHQSQIPVILADEHDSETSTSPEDALENVRINEELQRLDEREEAIESPPIDPTEIQPAKEPNHNETLAVQTPATPDASTANMGAGTEQDRLGGATGQIDAGENEDLEKADHPENSPTAPPASDPVQDEFSGGPIHKQTVRGGSEKESTFSETWEVLRNIEALIRESVNLPPTAPLTECKPDVASQIPKELIEALEDTISILARQRKNESKAEDAEHDEAAERPSSIQLHEIKDLEMWAIKNKYLTHVSSTTVAGVLPPEDLSADTRACGYPVPRVYLYQRLEQQANWKEERRLRMARKKSNEWKVLGDGASTVGSVKYASTSQTSELRPTLKQQMEKHRAQYVGKDLDFIYKSKERKKQSFDHHKEVMRKSEDSIENLRAQTRSIKVKQEWVRFQDKVLERVRLQRALDAAIISERS
ncbi:hypothetical protein BSKO_05053 [Bryopsis sp. KO-2023]|nr:hypothetical protein BSKO_05053 [Bryopsis sp. KO-2023]